MANQTEHNNPTIMAPQNGVAITHIGLGLLFLLVLLGISAIFFTSESVPETAVVPPTSTPTRTPRPTRTPTPTTNPSASATPTRQSPLLITRTPTNTPIPPTATATATSTTTNTPTATATPTHTATPSPIHTATPVPTATPATIVVESVQAAAFFAAPAVSSGQLGAFVAVGETVEVIGRTQNNGWLLARHPGGQLGWVTASFFAVDPTALADIPIMGDVIVTVVPDAPLPTNTPASSLPNIAYWNNVSTQANDEGIWEVVLAIRVPSGSGYEFATQEGLTISSATLLRTEGVYDVYTVSIAGMSCGGSLINGLTVTRNGQPYLVRSEFSPDEDTEMFIASPDC